MAKERKLTKMEKELQAKGFTIGKPSPNVGTKDYSAKKVAEHMMKEEKKRRGY
jgi:hypothetical protein